jgi:hypothetical protein
MSRLNSILLVAALALPALGQQTLPMSAILPAPVSGLRAQNGCASPVPGTFSATYYVVANYAGGAVRSNPVTIYSIPASLSGSNCVVLTWNGVTGMGVTYDVLKVAVGTAPAQGASTSLATGLTTATYSDEGGSLSPYTQAGFPYQTATALFRLNNWDYAIPAIEGLPANGYPLLAIVPLTDGNLGIQARGAPSQSGIGIELLGKGSGPLIWDNVTIADSTGAAPNAVYSVEAQPTLAQVNAGFTLLAGKTTQTIKVLHVLLTSNGGSTAACTGVLLEDTNTSPVIALTVLTAGLTSGTPVDETKSSATPGAGFAPATLTAGKGLQIIKDGSTACTTATSYSVIVFYKLNS